MSFRSVTFLVLFFCVVFLNPALSRIVLRCYNTACTLEYRRVYRAFSVDKTSRILNVEIQSWRARARVARKSPLSLAKKRVSLIYNSKDRKRDTYPRALPSSTFCSFSRVAQVSSLKKERERERRRESSNIPRIRVCLVCDGIILKTSTSRVGNRLHLSHLRLTFDVISCPTDNLWRSSLRFFFLFMCNMQICAESHKSPTNIWRVIKDGLNLKVQQIFER